MVVFECEGCGSGVEEDDAYIVTVPEDGGRAFCTLNCMVAWGQTQIQLNNLNGNGR